MQLLIRLPGITVYSDEPASVVVDLSGFFSQQTWWTPNQELGGISQAKLTNASDSSADILASVANVGHVATYTFATKAALGVTYTLELGLASFNMISGY